MGVLEQPAPLPNPVNPLKVIELTGNPRERGYQYGHQLKNAITQFLKEEFYDPSSSFSKAGLSQDTLRNYARKHIPYIEDYSQESIEVLKGISEGSGIPFEDIVLINMHEDIKPSSSPLYEGHCTAFGATWPATVNEEIFVAQNWDALFLWERYLNGDLSFLLHERRTNGPNVMAYAAPGFMTWAGMNSNGISLSWDSVPRRNLQIGVPTYVIVSEITRAKNIGEALAAIVRAKRAGCFNFIIGDENGELYDVEATPEDIDIFYPAVGDGTVGHGNVYDRLKINQEKDWIQAINGWDNNTDKNLHRVHRHNRIKKLLAQNRGHIDLQVCESFLRDHVNYPWSICWHMTKTCPQFTFDSWVMIPNKREWWIARYPQCQTEYKKYVVN